MAQRYQDPSEQNNCCPFRVVSLVRRQNGRKTSSFMAVAVDDDMETMKFFQEHMQEVIHNVKLVKQMEAVDEQRQLSEEPRRHATHGMYD